MVVTGPDGGEVRHATIVSVHHIPDSIRMFITRWNQQAEHRGAASRPMHLSASDPWKTRLREVTRVPSTEKPEYLPVELACQMST